MLTEYQKQLIVDNYSNVRAMAYTQHKALHSSTDVNDLIGDGAIGLIDAAVKYDPDKCSNFMGYAHIRIYGEMMCGLRNFNWSTRHIRAKEKRTGEEPKLVSCCEPEKLYNIRVGSFEESVDDRLRDQEIINQSFSFFETLKPRHQDIMKAIYQEGLTFKTVGERFGVNESRISQIHGEAIKKLKKHLNII